MNCLSADLLVDHVAHCHSDLHACSLHMVEVEVMEQRQANGADGQGGRVAESLVQSFLILWVIILKVHNHLPQDDRLDHFNDLLICRGGDKEG